jgi:protein-S-isoprenylcysteine O-methyltransferase Ste14
MNIFTRLLRRTPVRTFVIYPLVVLFGEWIIHGQRPEANLWFSPLMLWGYLQYRLCGDYRAARGGGGPCPETPGERLVSSGLYAYTRNPMYLGHIIFLTGWSLTLRSWLGGVITIVVTIWLHFRVLADERNLSVVLGPEYISYTRSVKRWLPGLF